MALTRTPWNRLTLAIGARGRHLWVAALIALMNSLVLADSHNVDTLRTYSDPKERFSTVLPPGWRIVQPSDSVDGVYFVRDATAETGINAASVSVIFTGASTNLTAMADSAGGFIAKQPGVSAWEVVSDRDVSISGLPALERINTATINDAELMFHGLFVQPQDAQFGFNMTLTGHADDMPRLLPQFKRMIDNLQVNE